LDCEAYVALVKSSEAKAAAIRQANNGAIEFLMTHVQWDEIAALADRTVRLSICEIPHRNVPTHRMIREGFRPRARFAPEPSATDLPTMIELGWSREFLVLVAAQNEDAVLVTNDDSTRERATSEAVEVWTKTQLITFLAG
jgi:hypothetical protein